MTQPRNFFQASIGKKYLVAATGLVLIGYVIGHLLGNLQIFLGRDAINTYAQQLHAFGPLLWVARIFLLSAFVLHIYLTIKLAIENRRARAERYEYHRAVRTSAAARTMLISGLIVLSFVIYHVLHFTTHTVNPEFAAFEDPTGRPDVYRMMIVGFSNPFASFFYLLGLFLLTMHLSHGFSSFLQTFGANNRRIAPGLESGGRFFAWIIFVGYASIPIAVLLGLLTLD